MIVGAVVATPVALCYGQLASAYPIAGGEYTWTARVARRQSSRAPLRAW
jgi:amino acid transporter